ncbi:MULTISPECIES: helix-turn-helix domain-containing protein [Streptomyces]|uniref:helix-turn-helix domain-containing protein n=1 Tax=Streptomyces TaxID=1883 RepID=UPI00200FF858|nr:helix-turn-helix domain-containing protein [Streptomyces sp. LRE541]UPZ28822.1 helix-turn-helix domain-containing protein [Streptomyces sp. LRE541]
MSRWKKLPDSLDPQVRQFVVHLRRLKDHSGLGLARLADRTGYSRSSWDRYLNGKALPPVEAVEALARACDTDPVRLVAQWEVAAEAWGTAPAPASTTAPGPGPGGTAAGDRRARPPWRAMALSSAVTALVMLAVFALLAPWEDDDGDKGTDAKPYTGEAHPKMGEFVYRPGKNYPCSVKRDDDGLLYAGYSRTRVELIQQSSTRWSVVEAQCLLEYHHESPGAADGVFGNATERAVKRAQEKGKVAVDGKIGPDTWGVLRR